MTLGPTKLLPALAVFTALVHGAAQAQNLHVTCKPAQIAFDVPKAWVIDNENTLFEQGFIVPPEPLYALVASPGPSRATTRSTLRPCRGCS
jgi:hypothetical protein